MLRSTLFRGLTQVVQVAVCLGLVTTCPAQDAEKPRTPNVANDLKTPPATNESPGPGKRVRQVNKNYVGSGVYHLLYLPIDWQPKKRYPVIVEYAGNQWKTSPGTVEGSHLGYGISGGKGAIWICMPFVDREHKKNALKWWGNIDATVAYCKTTVESVCEKFGGDRNNVFVAGFSRGAIACNYIGLHDDSIASLWKGFICHSHYDGVREWNYPASDRESAKSRLRRLGNRPQFISHEELIKPVEEYLADAYPRGNFTFLAIPGIGHTDQWVLRPSPERRKLREWFANVSKTPDQLE
ncbi:MAG: hypothetical protein AAF497_02795 [Planctomycetota bacterium]